MMELPVASRLAVASARGLYLPVDADPPTGATVRLSGVGVVKSSAVLPARNAKDGRPAGDLVRYVEVAPIEYQLHNVRVGNELPRAVSFLDRLLGEGPVSASRALSEARRAGFSTKTLRRAKAALGVRSLKRGYAGGWVWQMQSAIDKD